MKKVFLIAAFVFCGGVYAQESKLKTMEDPEFKSKSMIINDATKVIELLNNASFKNKDITIEKADKIQFNIETNEIVVSGAYTYSFKGDVVFKTGEDSHELRYRLGDDRIFIN
jgi:archaellum component FlaF (FlaF/FlaG flagellin family)